MVLPFLCFGGQTTKRSLNASIGNLTDSVFDGSVNLAYLPMPVSSPAKGQSLSLNPDWLSQQRIAIACSFESGLLLSTLALSKGSKTKSERDTEPFQPNPSDRYPSISPLVS